MTLATIFTCAAMAAVGTLVFVLGPLCFEPVSSFQPELIRTARRATAATTPSGHDSRFRRRYCFFHKRYDCHRASGSIRTGSALGQQKEEHRVQGQGQGQVQGQEEPILELESSRKLLDSPSPEQQPQEQEQRPWTTAMVDYSGANEYIEAHYGRHPSLQTTLWRNTAATPAAPYFSSGNQPNNPDTSTRNDVVEERIYNGRQVMPIQMTRALNTNSSTNRDTFIAGHANNHRNHRSENNASPAACHRTTMERYGMTLVHSPTAVRNWMDPREIQDSYVRELEALLPCLFSSEIRMHCFWNPMLRGEALELSPPRNDKGNDKDDDNDNDNDNEAVPDIPTANVASMVHIDTDIGAYESLDEFLAIVEANRVPRGTTTTTTTTTTTPFDRARWASSILEDRKRFAVVNFWRNTHPDLPVTMSNRPLAILSTHYSDDDRTNHAATDTDRILPAFPYVRPDTERSKWYCFPNMTSDELLIFYQYDRAVKQPSDLWHCAISQVPAAKNADGAEPRQRAPETNTTTTPRESFDIRALVVFDEAVPPDEDRFHPGRMRPVLSFEESGCFCDEQGLARTNKEEP